MEDRKNWRKITSLLANSSEAELQILLDLFLTPHERKTLIGRFDLIVELLNAKLSQREISGKLGQSISKITAGSKAIQILKEKERQFLLEKMKVKIGRSDGIKKS
ncbi:MAG: trp operon repressor [Oligoflexales bacterium]|nr:trp operon repressor [Oligoflexales bacterium]